MVKLKGVTFSRSVPEKCEKEVLVESDGMVQIDLKEITGDTKTPENAVQTDSLRCFCFKALVLIGCGIMVITCAAIGYITLDDSLSLHLVNDNNFEDFNDSEYTKDSTLNPVYEVQLFNEAPADRVVYRAKRDIHKFPNQITHNDYDYNQNQIPNNYPLIYNGYDATNFNSFEISQPHQLFDSVPQPDMTYPNNLEHNRGVEEYSKNDIAREKLINTGYSISNSLPNYGGYNPSNKMGDISPMQTEKGKYSTMPGREDFYNKQVTDTTRESIYDITKQPQYGELDDDYAGYTTTFNQYATEMRTTYSETIPNLNFDQSNQNSYSKQQHYQNEHKDDPLTQERIALGTVIPNSDYQTKDSNNNYVSGSDLKVNNHFALVKEYGISTEIVYPDTPRRINAVEQEQVNYGASPDLGVVDLIADSHHEYDNPNHIPSSVQSNSDNYDVSSIMTELSTFNLHETYSTSAPTDQAGIPYDDAFKNKDKYQDSPNSKTGTVNENQIIGNKQSDQISHTQATDSSTNESVKSEETNAESENRELLLHRKLYNESHSNLHVTDIEQAYVLSLESIEETYDESHSDEMHDHEEQRVDADEDIRLTSQKSLDSSPSTFAISENLGTTLTQSIQNFTDAYANDPNLWFPNNEQAQVTSSENIQRYDSKETYGKSTSNEMYNYEEQKSNSVEDTHQTTRVSFESSSPTSAISENLSTTFIHSNQVAFSKDSNSLITNNEQAQVTSSENIQRYTYENSYSNEMYNYEDPKANADEDIYKASQKSFESSSSPSAISENLSTTFIQKNQDFTDAFVKGSNPLITNTEQAQVTSSENIQQYDTEDDESHIDEIYNYEEQKANTDEDIPQTSKKFLSSSSTPTGSESLSTTLYQSNHYIKYSFTEQPARNGGGLQTTPADITHEVVISEAPTSHRRVQPLLASTEYIAHSTFTNEFDAKSQSYLQSTSRVNDNGELLSKVVVPGDGSSNIEHKGEKESDMHNENNYGPPTAISYINIPVSTTIKTLLAETSTKATTQIFAIDKPTSVPITQLESRDSQDLSNSETRKNPNSIENKILPPCNAIRNTRGLYVASYPTGPCAGCFNCVPRKQSFDTSTETVLQASLESLYHRNSTRSIETCPTEEISCQDGSKCIKIEYICDGNVNCKDASDEQSCPCTKKISKLRLCDGYPDCPNGEDEKGCFGCTDDMFSCDDWSPVQKLATCIPKEQRCDGIEQCPTGKDEQDCSMLIGTTIEGQSFEVSNTVGFLHRNNKGQWYPVCHIAKMWATEVCATVNGPSDMLPLINLVSFENNYNGAFLDGAFELAPQIIDNCRDAAAMWVECPPVTCGTCMKLHNPYRSEEVDVSAERVLSQFQPPKFQEEIVSDSRVVGGNPSQPESWPWIIAIYRNGLFHCGGVIINERWVLTAAHCVDRYWLYYFEIQAGIIRRYSFSPMEQNRRVSRIITYKHYDRARLKNDLSLIEVAEPFIFSRYVRPICLPSERTAGQNFFQGPLPGTICTAVGWGATAERGSDPDNLREVEVPILSKCKHLSDEEGNAICAGLLEGGKDACQGDSGGPLMCRNPNLPLQWYLAGIVSHGEGCARPNEPGVYTRVSLFLEWIFTTTNAKVFPPRRPLRQCPGYVCKDTRRCISNKKRCDKIVDCLNADDEIHCERSGFSNIFREAMKHMILGSPAPQNNTNTTLPLETSTTLPSNKSATTTPSTGTTLRPITIEQIKQTTIPPSTTLSPTAHQSSKQTLPITTIKTNTTTAPELETSTTSEDRVFTVHGGGTEHTSIGTTINPFNLFNITITTSKPFSAMPHSTIAPHGHFQCKRMLETIDLHKVCNRVADCQDATDEENCYCSDFLKHDHSEVICDGINDCWDGSDESCGVCNFNEYNCHKSRICIPNTKLCDFKNDCPFSEDEEDCFALTDQFFLDLDKDNRPVLRSSGILSFSNQNGWSVLCRDDWNASEATYSSVICSYLGFSEYKSFVQVPVNTTFISSNGNKKPAITDDTNNCKALHVTCMDIVDVELGSESIDNPTIIDQTPWYVEIYIDGQYYCSGVLLSEEWIITSSNCSLVNRLNQHFVLARIGNFRSYLEVPSAAERAINIMESSTIHQTDIVLLHLNESVTLSRYIRPLHFNVRDYVVTEKEVCAAMGRHLKKMKIILLQSVSNCKSGYRCFQRLLPQTIPCQYGQWQAWSGAIVCHSRNGWYPAAAFNEARGFCGFSGNVTYTSIQYWKKDIQRAMERAVYAVQPPDCKAGRCNNGKCLMADQICDKVSDCPDQVDEDPTVCKIHYAGCEKSQSCACLKSELRCANGNCTSKSNFCNTKNDCGDWSDEPELCTCKSYLAMTSPAKICDGVRNCFDKTDEDPRICKCTDDHYQCTKSTWCVPKDYVCDGFKDCPYGDDESVCFSLTSVNNSPKEVYVQTAGVWHPGCFPSNMTVLELEDLCSIMGYTTGSAKKLPGISSAGYTPITDPFIGVGINGIDRKRVVIPMRSGANPSVSLKRSQSCYRLFLECLH